MGTLLMNIQFSFYELALSLLNVNCQGSLIFSGIRRHYIIIFLLRRICLSSQSFKPGVRRVLAGCRPLEPVTTAIPPLPFPFETTPRPRNFAEDQICRGPRTQEQNCRKTGAELRFRIGVCKQPSIPQVDYGDCFEGQSRISVGA